jgi:hypothetical protein
VPFVQGQLRGEFISGCITTECAHCKQPLHIEIDSELHYEVMEKGAKPMIFAPLTVVQPGAPSIIDGF